MKQDLTTIYYNQLIAAKQCIDKLRDEVNYKINQQALISQNLKRPHVFNRRLKDFYNKFIKYISQIDFKDLSQCQGHYVRSLNKKIDIVDVLSSVCIFTENEYVTLNELSKIVDDQNQFSYFKKRAKQFKSLTVETPIKIIEDCFNCELIIPKPGDKFDETNMESYFLAYTEVLDDFKEIRKNPPGTYVDQCLQYGVKDKSSGKLLLKPLTAIYSIEVSDRLKNFHIVK